MKEYTFKTKQNKHSILKRTTVKKFCCILMYPLRCYPVGLENIHQYERQRFFFFLQISQKQNNVFNSFSHQCNCHTDGPLKNTQVGHFTSSLSSSVQSRRKFTVTSTCVRVTRFHESHSHLTCSPCDASPPVPCITLKRLPGD